MNTENRCCSCTWKICTWKIDSMYSATNQEDDMPLTLTKCPQTSCYQPSCCEWTSIWIIQEPVNEVRPWVLQVFLCWHAQNQCVHCQTQQAAVLDGTLACCPWMVIHPIHDSHICSLCQVLLSWWQMEGIRCLLPCSTLQDGHKRSHHILISVVGMLLIMVVLPNPWEIGAFGLRLWCAWPKQVFSGRVVVATSAPLPCPWRNGTSLRKHCHFLQFPDHLQQCFRHLD